jgi:heme/copper-type cytochrome/quinol oxidase subunit 2
MSPTTELLIMNGVMISILIALVFIGNSSTNSLIKMRDMNPKQKLKAEKIQKIKIYAMSWLVMIGMFGFFFAIFWLSLYTHTKRNPEVKVNMEKEWVPPANHNWR